MTSREGTFSFLPDSFRCFFLRQLWVSRQNSRVQLSLPCSYSVISGTIMRTRSSPTRDLKMGPELAPLLLALGHTSMDGGSSTDYLQGGSRTVMAKAQNMHKHHTLHGAEFPSLYFIFPVRLGWMWQTAVAAQKSSWREDFSERGWHLPWILKDELEFSRLRRAEPSGKGNSLILKTWSEGVFQGEWRGCCTQGVGGEHIQGDLDTS